jgi:ribokinase
VTGTATGFVTVVVTRDGKKTMIAAHNANHVWSAADVANAVSAVGQAAAKAILVADSAVASDPVEQSARAARARQFPIVLDPSPAPRVSERLFPLADYVTPNPAETRHLTGVTVRSESDAVRAGRIFNIRRTQTALMKMPEGGCVIVTKDSAIAIRSTPVKAVDTTGAGDCFAGAFAVALLDGRNLVEATRFAVAATHVSVDGYAAQASYPDRAACRGDAEANPAAGKDQLR